MVVEEEVGRLFLAELFERICPQDVAHETVCRWLAETVNLKKSDVSSIIGRFAYGFEVVQGVQLRAKPTVYAEKLLIHDGRQG